MTFYRVIKETVKGHPIFWAREVGCVTKSRMLAWKTTDHTAAHRFAEEYGGTVLEVTL